MDVLINFLHHGFKKSLLMNTENVTTTQKELEISYAA